MVTLGDLSETLNQEDTCAILDLYNVAPSTCKEAGTGVEIPFAMTNYSSNINLVMADLKGQALSSPEDEPSNN